MTGETEKLIYSEMGKIGKIQDFWQLHIQAGYQMFGRTKDERYLGYVDFAQGMIKQMNELNEQKEEIKEDNGYQSTVG